MPPSVISRLPAPWRAFARTHERAWIDLTPSVETVDGRARYALVEMVDGSPEIQGFTRDYAPAAAWIMGFPEGHGAAVVRLPTPDHHAGVPVIQAHSGRPGKVVTGRPGSGTLVQQRTGRTTRTVPTAQTKAWNEAMVAEAMRAWKGEARQTGATRDGAGPAMAALQSPTKRYPWLPSGEPGFIQFKGGHSHKDYATTLAELDALLAPIPDKEALRAWILSRAQRETLANLPDAVEQGRELGFPEERIAAFVERAQREPGRNYVVASFNIARALIDKDPVAYTQYFTKRNRNTWKEVTALTGSPPDQHELAQERAEAQQRALKKEAEQRAARAAARKERERRNSYGETPGSTWTADNLFQYFDEEAPGARSMSVFKKRYNFDGQDYAVAEWIERMIEDGWIPREYTVVTPRSRKEKTAYRLDKYGESQFFPLKKSEHDYAWWYRQKSGLHEAEMERGDPEAEALFRRNPGPGAGPRT